MTSTTDASADFSRPNRPGAPSVADLPVDWRAVSEALVPDTGAPVTLQRVLRDELDEIVDLEILLFLGDDRFDRDLVEGRLASQLNADWDPEVELPPIRRAVETGRPIRHAVFVNGFEPGWFLLETRPITRDLVFVSYVEIDEAHADTRDIEVLPSALPAEEPGQFYVVASASGRVAHMSSKLADLLGWSVEALVQTGLAEVLSVESSRSLIESCGRLAAGCGTADDSDHHLELRRSDGASVHTRWALRYVSDVGVVGVGTDVTKQVESERQLRSVLDAVATPIVILDRTTLRVSNRAWKEFTGNADERASTREWHPEDWPGVVAAADRTLATGAPTTVEGRLRRHDGEWRWVLDTITPLEDEHGSYLVAVHVDIHDHRVAERRLGELVELMPDIVFRMRLHPERELEYVSQAFERISGYSVEENYANPGLGYEMCHPDDRWLFDRLTRGELDDVVFRSFRKDGELCWVSMRVHHDRDADGRVVAMTGITRDVTPLKAIEEDLAHRATHDELTDLPNRRFLKEVLAKALARWRRDPSMQLAVLFLDLDRFKLVNDTHGHDVGDVLLRRVTDRISSAVRGGDVVARLGGDEFAVLLEAPTVAEIVGVADRVLSSLDTHLEAGGYELYAAASGGLAFANEDVDTTVDLLRHADTALARAKDRGRNCLELFDDRLRHELEERHRLEQQLRGAVEIDGIDVHFQPIVELSTGRILAVEALARWTNADGVVVSPASFIPLAEETGVINTLGPQVLRRSLEALGTWHRGGHRVELNVNVSARRLATDAIVDETLDSLTAAGIDPHWLCVEVTETLLMSDGDGPARRLAALRQHGVRVAVDDFGTGFSSLAYLDRLPIDVLKIDRSFVARFDEPSPDRRRTAIARSVVDLADALGLSTCAEGVETEQQRDHLLELGCSVGQGYLYSPARSASQIWSMLDRDVNMTRRGGVLPPS